MLRLCSRQSGVPRLPTSLLIVRRDSSTSAFGGSAKGSSTSPFYLETAYSLFAKRPSRPFPPPFASPPSRSFSDPLSTHDQSRDRRLLVKSEYIRGITNGDDAILASEQLLITNDGVGAWAYKEKGHAALWSRLILHFWALGTEQALESLKSDEPDPVAYLQWAYEQTQKATSSPNEWFGTTTACGALLHSPADSNPALYITNLGDSQVLVIRPGPKPSDTEDALLFKTAEQWHWFDCPRQLGTNSPDVPSANAVTSRIDIQEGDVVLAMSDGVVDNLWEHEIIGNVLESIRKWSTDESVRRDQQGKDRGGGVMDYTAAELVRAARAIAEDQFAESPFMERAIDEGLAMEGGKLDDISVVAGICRRRKRSKPHS